MYNTHTHTRNISYNRLSIYLIDISYDSNQWVLKMSFYYFFFFFLSYQPAWTRYTHVHFCFVCCCHQFDSANDLEFRLFLIFFFSLKHKFFSLLLVLFFFIWFCMWTSTVRCCCWLFSSSSYFSLSPSLRSLSTMVSFSFPVCVYQHCGKEDHDHRSETRLITFYVWNHFMIY